MTIKAGIYDKAKLVNSPNKGGYIKPRLIVVHDTAGALNAAGSVSWLCNPVAKASAHFVVDRDGAVTQLISCNLKAWHAGQSAYNGVANVNDFSVGIEIVNPGHMQPSGPKSARAGFGGVFDRKQYAIEELEAQRLLNPDNPHGPISHPAGLWMPYPQAQLDAVLALCLDLKTAYGITEVAAHWGIAPTRKVDTNPLFPLRWLRAKLEGRVGDPEPKQVEAGPKVPSPVPVHGVGEPLTPVPLPPDPLAVPAVYVLPTEGNFIREWPSFNDNKVTVSLGHGPFKVMREAKYHIEGEGIPAELENTMLPWYVIEYHDNETDTMNTAFLLKSSARIV